MLMHVKLSEKSGRRTEAHIGRVLADLNCFLERADAKNEAGPAQTEAVRFGCPRRFRGLEPDPLHALGMTC
jgi:hypothetical protein